MQCCLGINGKDNDPSYSKAERSGLLVGETNGSIYSSVEDFLNHHKSIHADVINLWTNPSDVTHSLEEDDRTLMALLEENESCTSSQKRELIEKEIKKIRDERKAIQKRWKGIMILLGFDQQADELLDVHTLARLGDPTHTRAAEIHRRLVQESNIFGYSSTQAVRYIAVIDRLLDLDVAESFMQKAMRQYPKALEA